MRSLAVHREIQPGRRRVISVEGGGFSLERDVGISTAQ